MIPAVTAGHIYEGPDLPKMQSFTLQHLKQANCLTREVLEANIRISAGIVFFCAWFCYRDKVCSRRTFSVTVQDGHASIHCVLLLLMAISVQRSYTANGRNLCALKFQYQ